MKKIIYYGKIIELELGKLLSYQCKFSLQLH